jgi:hypothetical protein
MANQANTLYAGKARGGYRSAIYRDARGRTFGCQVLSVQAGPTYTIRIPSRMHLPAAQHTLTGIAQGTSRSDVNVVLASALQP